MAKITTGNSTLTLVLLACLAIMAGGQNQTGLLSGARGVVRLRVRVKIDDSTKRPVGLSRKRFFLIKGSLDDNKSLLQSIGQRAVVSRDCYYRAIGASEELITWLKQSDCESIYCREVETKDVEGAAAVPEFQHAIAAGEKEFGSRDLARKWLAVNLSDELRSGFYKRQQADLQTLLKQAEEISRAKVMSVMTDRTYSRPKSENALHSGIAR